LTIVFLTRIATVDMVLWDDTSLRIVPCDSQQYIAYGVAVQEQLNMLQGL